MKLSKVQSLILFMLVLATLIFLNGKSKNDRLHTELIGKTEKLELLNKYIANLERRYIKQDHLQKVAIEVFTKEVIKNRKRIKVLSNATFLIRENARKSGKSDITYHGKRMKYIINEIRYKNGPPIGYVLIFDDGGYAHAHTARGLGVLPAVSGGQR